MSTTAGRKITATSNHEFLTQNGYKRLQDISVGDTVYTPRHFGECLNYPTLSEKESDLWRLVGLYIGDGTKNKSSLSNIDPDIIQDYTNILDKYFNCGVRINKEQLSAFQKTKNTAQNQEIIDPEQLKYLYIDLNLTIRQLCELYKTSDQTIKSQLIYNKIIPEDYDYREHSKAVRIKQKESVDISVFKDSVVNFKDTNHSKNNFEKFLSTFEFHQLYSKERYIPSNLSLPQLAQVLAGIFLTDGTVVDVNKQPRISFSFSTSSRRLALDIQGSLQRFGMSSSITFACKKRPKNKGYYDPNYHVIVRGHKNASLFLQYIPIYGIKKLKLERAISKISNMNKTTYLGDLQELKVVSIVEEQEKQETYDISVANLNYIERNYLAEGLIVHNCVDLNYLAKLGVDTSEEKFLLIQPDSGVQALTVMEEFCEAGVCSVVILDSIASLRTEQEVNGDVGDQHMAVLARLLSAPMKNLTSSAKKTNTAILFINQVRAGIGIYGAPDVTPGGNSVKFYPSLRISVARKDWIKKGEEPIGQVIRARTIKNRMNNPYKVEEISLIFGEGIDQVIEAVDVAIDNNIIVKGGAWFNFTSVDGEQLKLQGRESVYEFYKNSSKDFEDLKSKLLTNKDLIVTEENPLVEDEDE